jgi:hypothetical protein
MWVSVIGPEIGYRVAAVMLFFVSVASYPLAVASHLRRGLGATALASVLLLPAVGAVLWLPVEPWVPGCWALLVLVVTRQSLLLPGGNAAGLFWESGVNFVATSGLFYLFRFDAVAVAFALWWFWLIQGVMTLPRLQAGNERVEKALDDADDFDVAYAAAEAWLDSRSN